MKGWKGTRRGGHALVLRELFPRFGEDLGIFPFEIAEVHEFRPWIFFDPSSSHPCALKRYQFCAFDGWGPALASEGLDERPEGHHFPSGFIHLSEAFAAGPQGLLDDELLAEKTLAP